ncbi:condensation domain-containing protein [Streptomyces sp. NPDC051001]|uniref:condensation domain-containing protein n=1 Tax=Streptomyces sp. NPDC051001 TaxID=3155795 RepID=UPI0034298E8B
MASRADRAPFPMTAGQASMYFADQKATNSRSYNAPSILDVHAPLTCAHLKEACRTFARRTPTLRLRMGIDEWTGEVVQWFTDDEPDVEILDLTDAATDTFDRLVEERSARPFETDEGPLSRLLVVSRGPRRTTLVSINHHLVVDGTSFETLVRRLGAAVADTLPQQPEDAYRRLVDRVRRIAHDGHEEAQAHWTARLPRGTSLRPWRTGPGATKAGGDGRLDLALPPEAGAGLTAAASAAGVSTFALFASAVHRALPVEDAGVSAVCAAASVRPQGNSTVPGYFVQEVPLIADPATGGSLRELAVRSAPLWRSDLRQRHFPLVELLPRVTESDSPAPTRLTSVLLSYREGDRAIRWTENGIRFSSRLLRRYPSAKSELCVTAVRSREALDVEVQWGCGLPVGLGASFGDSLRRELETLCPVE